MIILSVDYGKARTGIAVCDKNEMLASPEQVITEYHADRLAEKVVQIAKNKQAEMIVLGLPKNMDGSEGESAQNVRLFAKMLEERSAVPVVLWDERLSTVTAHEYLNMTNTRGKKRKAVVDSVAAVIILEDYLRFRRNGL